jgi:hypothetical protein
MPTVKLQLKASPPTTIRITIANDPRGTGTIPAFTPLPLRSGAAQTAVERRVHPRLYGAGAFMKARITLPTPHLAQPLHGSPPAKTLPLGPENSANFEDLTSEKSNI